MTDVLLLLCGIFYAVLCVFSIVTGLMYAGGKRELNPLELSDRFMSRYSDPEKRKRFTVRMGWVTFGVGLVQGIAAFAILAAGRPLYYWIALGFTVFSIASVAVKLKGKINAFPLLKCAAYAVILFILLTGSARARFFAPDAPPRAAAIKQAEPAPEAPEPIPTEEEGEEKTMIMKIGDTAVPVTWEDNPSVEALRALLPLTVEMSMYGGFEQVGALGHSLPREDRQTTTEAGDIVLYSGDQIVVFYGSNAWAYTRLGHVELSGPELEALLSNGDVTVTIAEVDGTYGAFINDNSGNPIEIFEEGGA